MEFWKVGHDRQFCDLSPPSLLDSYLILLVHTPVDGAYRLEFLRAEIAISTNTAAAGGNASLLAIS